MATRRYNNPINQDVSTRYASDLNDQECARVRPYSAHKHRSGKKRTVDIHEVRTKAGRNPKARVGIIDSQSVPTTEMGGEKGCNPAKQVKGRKRHLLTNTLGLILFVVVSAASIVDSDGAKYIFTSN